MGTESGRGEGGRQTDRQTDSHKGERGNTETEHAGNAARETAGRAGEEKGDRQLDRRTGVGSQREGDGVRQTDSHKGERGATLRQGMQVNAAREAGRAGQARRSEGSYSYVGDRPARRSIS